MPRILDVGCGPTKYPGSIGLDMNPSTAADVICHLDHGGLPFRDNSFDQVRAEHVIEHVANIIATMEEFHRVTRPGGTIFLATPHYTDYSSFRDPTHRWHLNTYSFIYFYPGGMHGRDMWYTKVRMREVKLNLSSLKLLARAGLRVPGEPQPHVPPVLGALFELRDPRENDGVHIRGDQVSAMPRILDIGCGRKKYPGSIGIDMSPAGQADVLCDWERTLPFADSSFDRVRMIHIIEEVDNIFRVLAEVHRVAKPGARVVRS